MIRRVLSYAIATGRAERNIALDIQGALAPLITKSFAAITEPRAIGKLLRAIDQYDGTPIVCAALRLSPLLFTRPGELRRCEWKELDLDAEYPEWRIPAEKMKMRDAHIVPLSTQSVSILRELQLHTGKGRYVFPSARGGGRPMSENTVNVALRALGYNGDTQVAHGFRVIASTRLNKLGWHGDLIELQLAHKPRGVRAIYNRSERIEERRRMMQSWADHLDQLSAADSNVVAIRAREVANAI